MTWRIIIIMIFRKDHIDLLNEQLQKNNINNNDNVSEEETFEETNNDYYDSSIVDNINVEDITINDKPVKPQKNPYPHCKEKGWDFTDNKEIGQRIRKFDTSHKYYDGTIIGYLDSTFNEGKALWNVKDDIPCKGKPDYHDLSHSEVIECKLYHSLDRKRRPKNV